MRSHSTSLLAPHSPSLWTPRWRSLHWKQRRRRRVRQQWEETWRGKKTTWKGKKLRKRKIRLTWNHPARWRRLLSAASVIDFKSENGLKIHIGKAHKSSDPPTEKLRDAILPALKPLVISPIRETRIIHCNNCDDLMSPNHTCDLEEIPDPSPKPPKKTCNKCNKWPPFSKCTQDLCRQCCSDTMCYFKKGLHDTWWVSKPSYENVIQ